MPSRSWQFRIDDIIEANKIDRYTSGFSFDSWCKDDKTIDAVIRNIEIIGEASSHLPEEALTQFENIPWRMMKAIRNILVHEYFGVDLEIIWKTVKEDLRSGCERRTTTAAYQRLSIDTTPSGLCLQTGSYLVSQGSGLAATLGYVTQPRWGMWPCSSSRPTDFAAYNLASGHATSS